MISFLGRLRAFWNETITEVFVKASWPTAKELVDSTLVVIAAVALPLALGIIMFGLGLDLTPADFQALGAYFASRPTIGHAVADPELAQMGRFIYVRGNPYSGVAACATCHGPRAHGSETTQPGRAQSRIVIHHLKLRAALGRTGVDNLIVDTLGLAAPSDGDGLEVLRVDVDAGLKVRRSHLSLQSGLALNRNFQIAMLLGVLHPRSHHHRIGLLGP